MIMLEIARYPNIRVAKADTAADRQTKKCKTKDPFVMQFILLMHVLTIEFL